MWLQMQQAEKARRRVAVPTAQDLAEAAQNPVHIPDVSPGQAARQIAEDRHAQHMELLRSA